jgi:hypothetical protein
MKQELSQELKEKIVNEVNQPELADDSQGNAQVITAKEAGLFEDASARGDIRGQIARFTAINVSSRAKMDALFDGAKLSSRNIKKAVLAATAIPDGEADIKFGGTPQQQEAAKALFYYLQTAITTRGIALERAIKLEQMEKAQAAKQQEQNKEQENE